MRTIPAAMTWELLAQGRWLLPASALGMLALPMLVLGILRSASGLDPHEESTYVLLFLFATANIFAVVTTLLAIVYQSARQMFPQPATAATLVSGRLLPAASLLALDVVCWSALLNALFQLDWPILEPAIFACAMLTASFAVLWVCYGSHWMIFGFTIVAAIFGYWMKSHCGAIFGMPSLGWWCAACGSQLRNSWSPMGLAEGAALAGASIAFHRMAIAGFARARRGEPPLSLGIVAWLNSLLERRLTAAATFPSHLAAQRWYFRRQMWIAPAAVLCVSLPGIVVWGFASGDPAELVGGFAFGCWGICIAAALGGVILGSLGSKSDVVLGQFLATRPIPTGEMARELLRTSALSCGLAWLVWALLFAVLLGVLLVAGHAPAEILPQEFNYKYLAAAIVVSWGVMGCVMTIALAGRAQLVFRAMLAVGAVIVLGIPAGKYALTPTAANRLYDAVVLMTCMAVVGGTIWSLWLANKRELITRRAVGLSVVAWAALASCAALAIPFGPTPSLLHWLFSWLLLFGSTALIVAPIAAAPLALAWNRTR